MTSGLDFAFVLLGLLRGEAAAKKIQLLLEYDPAPPFPSGHPRVADEGTVEAVKALAQPMLARRGAVSLEAARRLR